MHMTTNFLPYFYFKFALQHFGKSAHELTEEQQFLVEEQSKAEQRLHQLILRQPEAAQIVVDDETVERALLVIISRYTDMEEFRRDLEENKIDEELLQGGLRDELAVGSVLAMVGQSARKISRDEAREYFQNNRAEFTRPERRTVHQILITVDESGPEDNRRKASYDRLLSIRERLLTGKSDFSAEAAAHSECPSALNEGLLGTLPRGKLYPLLDKALFALSINEISDIIETELGFHLLYCKEVHPEHDITWDKIGTRIRERLQEDCEQRHVKDWIRKLED